MAVLGRRGAGLALEVREDGPPDRFAHVHRVHGQRAMGLALPDVGRPPVPLPLEAAGGPAVDAPRGSTEDTRMTVKIVAANEQASPAGKLADAELHFVEGTLDGLKLIGFSVWERRSPSGRRNVTFPARTYTVNGERRSFALLRPIGDQDAQDRVRDLILSAYTEHEAQYALAR